MRKLILIAALIASPAFAQTAHEQAGNCDAACLQRLYEEALRQAQQEADKAARDAAECAERQAKGKPCPVR